jgi:hypothetical protein
MDDLGYETRARQFKQTYESRIEAIHFASVFKQHLKSNLGWESPAITSSYMGSMNMAMELVQAKMIEVEYLDGLFDPYITRLTEKGKNLGYYFRVAVFKDFDVAYLYGFDYVGDELNLYAASSEDKFAPFFAAVKLRYKDYAKKENAGKLTIYTIEHGSPKTHVIPFAPITEETMVCEKETLDSIKTDLATFFADEELFKKFDIAHRRGVLLHGPPGCGKTMMCKHIATIAKVPVVQFFASAGCDTGDLIRFFEYLSDISPAIVIFEDLDSLFKGDLARSNFLNILDGACTDKQLSLLILATTNHVKEIDEALTQRPSRFDRQYHFDYPSAELRREYILKRFGKLKSLVEDERLMDVFCEEHR